MKYAARSYSMLLDHDIDADALGQVLGRLESFVPHLDFSSWAHGQTNEEPGTSEARWVNSDRTAVKLIAHLANGIRLSATCSRNVGAVSLSDYELLLELVSEALAVTNSGGSSSAASLFDYGTATIALDIQSKLKLSEDPVAILRFLRSLAHDTYENQRLAYGVIFTTSEKGALRFALSFDSKRTKALTDGFSTALLLDRHLKLDGMAALSIPTNEATSLSRRPWWCSALAEESKKRNGVGVALMRSGQIVVLHAGRLQFSLRAGRWQVWNHAEILSRLNGLWASRRGADSVHRVFSYLYHLALDLSFRRSGGLLIVLETKSNLRKLVLSAIDLVGSAKRGSTELALDKLVSAKLVTSIDRRIVADLASLDGALIVDRRGQILAYGAMTKSSSGAHQGARTRAAIAASRFGVAIKISSDGDICFLRKGAVRLVL